MPKQMTPNEMLEAMRIAKCVVKDKIRADNQKLGLYKPADITFAASELVRINYAEFAKIARANIKRSMAQAAKFG